ncbi:transformation system protein [Campylobacter sp. MIT 99-7217]|uniref:transformation system protein n=1 Tax=Campylobacter sp. MIT 99-7217 TaxID=535091 RepID=UPI001158B33B|nr:transformation system protein [Campylobacter sp. MIT 99-7217]TQR30615.1 transformation system protein [Campylobacter sp. MIT 99-7217]
MTKTQILELEERYKKFRLKRLMKRFLLIISCVFLCCGLYFFFLMHQEKEEALNLALKEKKNLTQKLELAKIKTQKQEVLLQRRIDKAENENKEDTKKEKIYVRAYALNPAQTKRDFYKKPSFKNAILLAHFYFENKAYEKSKFWALKANEIDKNNPEAWEIFIKSKLYLGQRSEALQVFTAYVSFYNPSNAQELKVLLDEF